MYGAYKKCFELPLLESLVFNPNTVPEVLLYKWQSVDTCPGANHLGNALCSSSTRPLI